MTLEKKRQAHVMVIEWGFAQVAALINVNSAQINEAVHRPYSNAN